MADHLIPHFILEQYQRGREKGVFQAATLFIDLAGFTPLTATLMLHQKDGVEVLAEALRSVFAPLVREVYRRGGIIPLFAGDAFTAIFPIVEDTSNSQSFAPHLKSAQQAAACALAIQKRMTHEDGVVSTRYGNFHLAATIGLSYGRVRWGIPGTAALRSFYFCGEAVDNCARAEHLARDGEIVADAHLLAILGTRVVSQSLADANFHRVIDIRTPLPVASQIPRRPSRAELAPFVPKAILDTRGQAEFRNICAVFLSFQEPPTESDLHDFLAAVMNATEQFGGVVNQIDFGDNGGYLLLIFGAPVAHEDDINRATECLLHLRDQNWTLPWRAGVAFGTVWAGTRGGDERAEYGVTGDVVILAHRLFCMAPWHEIWTDSAVYQKLCNSHIFDVLGQQPIKGRGAPQPVYRLLKSSHETTETGLYVPGLLERQPDLMRLESWIQPLHDMRSAGLFLIHGEPGIGKSYLVREFRRRLQDHRDLLWIKCVADSAHKRSFGPFRYALRCYFRERTAQPLVRDAQYNRELFHIALDDLIEALAGKGKRHAGLIAELDRTSSCLAALLDIRWAGSFYESLAPHSRVFAIFNAFQTLVNALAVFQPVVLYLDNVHWFDEESRAMIQILAHGSSDLPTAFLGTTRYSARGVPVQLELDNETSYQEINLSVLSVDGIAQVAAQVIQGDPSPELVIFLAEQTGGNPLFVEQLALDLWERGVIYPQQIDDHLVYGLHKVEFSIPASITSVLVSRLDRLEPAVKGVVQMGAVLGPEFDTAVLSHLVPDDPHLFQKVRSAQLAGIWRADADGTRYFFAHALLRDAAYDMQTRTKLRATHRMAAQAIEKIYQADLSPHAEQLAQHYEQAEDFEAAARWHREVDDQPLPRHPDNSCSDADDAPSVRQTSDEDEVAAAHLYAPH